MTISPAEFSSLLRQYDNNNERIGQLWELFIANRKKQSEADAAIYELHALWAHPWLYGLYPFGQARQRLEERVRATIGHFLRGASWTPIERHELLLRLLCEQRSFHSLRELKEPIAEKVYGVCESRFSEVGEQQRIECALGSILALLPGTAVAAAASRLFGRLLERKSPGSVRQRRAHLVSKK